MTAVKVVHSWEYDKDNLTVWEKSCENEMPGEIANNVDPDIGPLIATAPELLEACKRALEFADSVPGADRIGILLSKAIAKAEGENA